MLWQLGDGTTAGSDTVNKTYSNPGNYNVCLTITGGGCQDTYCKLINIPDKNLVKAGFNSSFSVSALPVTVQFSGIDSFGTGFSYLWDFGDGTYSSEINVSHTYTSLCTPTVCFTVRDAYNCQDTKCKTLSLCTNSIEPILTTSQQIVCYPIPTNDIIRVLHKEKNLHHCTLTITSVSGSIYASYEIGTLLKNEPVQLPIQDLSAGLYYLRIISDEGVFHTVISKQ
jgi:PKD repeat protein